MFSKNIAQVDTIITSEKEWFEEILGLDNNDTSNDIIINSQSK